MANYDYFDLNIEGEWEQKISFIQDLMIYYHQSCFDKHFHMYIDKFIFNGICSSKNDQANLNIEISFKYTSLESFHEFLNNFIKLENSRNMKISGTYFSECNSDDYEPIVYLAPSILQNKDKDV